MSALRQEVQKDLVGLRQEVKQDITSLRQETNQDSNSLRQEVSALRYWSWGSIIAVVVGTVTVILTLKPVGGRFNPSVLANSRAPTASGRGLCRYCFSGDTHGAAWRDDALDDATPCVE